MEFFHELNFFHKKSRSLTIIGPPSAREDKVENKIIFFVCLFKTGFLSSLLLQGEPRGPGYLEQTLGAMMTTFIVVVAAAGRTTWPWLPGANTWSNNDDISSRQKFDPEKITSKKEII